MAGARQMSNNSCIASSAAFCMDAVICKETGHRRSHSGQVALCLLVFHICCKLSGADVDYCDRRRRRQQLNMAARAVTSEAERAPVQPLLEPLLRQCSAEVPGTPQGQLALLLGPCTGFAGLCSLTVGFCICTAWQNSLVLISCIVDQN